MFIPTSINLPWKPEQVSIQGKNGYVINPEQVEYFKQLIKSLNLMYSEIANAINMEVSDAAFGVSWDEVKTIAPSKNAVYDEMVLRQPLDADLTGLSGLNMYYPDYAAADQGVTGDNNTIKYAVDTIAANNGTIFLRHNSGAATTTYTLSTSEVIPANINLIIQKGVILSIDTAITLTVNGPFEAGLYQVFSLTGTGAASFGAGSVTEIYPEWWATNTTPGTTDMIDALDAAVASVTGTPIVLTNVYLTTACWYLTHYTYLRFTKGAYILGAHTGPAIISMKGATQCVLYDANAHGDSITVPKTGIALGRTALNSAQENTLYRPSVEGYFSVAGYYSIAAEILTMYSPRANILGGGAKYVFYTSNEDALAIDTFTAGSNTIVNIYSPDWVNEQAGLVGASVIYINMTDNGVFGHLYSGGWLGSVSEDSAYITINSDFHGTPDGPIVFLYPHGEGMAVTGNGIVFTTSSIVDDIVLNGIEVVQGYFNTPGGAPYGYFAYGNDNITLINSRLESILPDAISLYNANRVDFGQYGISGVAVVRNTHVARITDQLKISSTVPSTNANTLDYYGEGTWTPTIEFGGASVNVTYDAGNTGEYVKIGRMVHFTGFLILTSKGTSVGNATIVGLPFTSASLLSPAIALSPNGLTFADAFHARVVVGTPYIQLIEITNAGVFSFLANTDFADTTSISFSGTYLAAE